ncbi:MAG: sulfite exporter TauE/SafE family protein [Patescibacteria group bacterium]|nr:sulfite exporter TauE/SafE family protein [Patescibacteria group bacterium]
MKPMLRKIKFHISGIHCRSCKTLIETEIDVLPGVKKTWVNYKTGETEVEFEEEKIRKEKIFSEIRRLNYEVKETAVAKDEKRKESGFKPFLYGLAFLLAIVFLIEIYLLIQKLGGFSLLAKLNEGNIGYGLIFVIGLLAGFHCVGMCGGLVVSYSASHLKRVKDLSGGDEKKSLTPHWQYNAGRLISYTAIGGVLGGVGSFFGINPTFTGIITLGAGVLMVLMGLSFISNWEFLEKIKLRTPQFFARFLYGQKYNQKPKGPFIIGLLNGFMPCGPLQAMQLYALASGSAIRGAASLAVYALGTIPLMFGFGVAISSIGQQYIKKIVKVSGILVIILGLFMANRGLTNFGYGFNSLALKNNVGQSQSPAIDDVKGYQTVKMEVSYLGYKPNTLYIKKGVPVRWVIDVKQLSGCTSAIMIESLGIKRNLKQGENIIEFTPPAGVKEIKFSCGMRMVWGKFIVNEDTSSAPGNGEENSIGGAAIAQAASTCGASGGSGGCGCGSGNRDIQTQEGTVESVPAAGSVAPNNATEQVLKAVYTYDQDIAPNTFTVKKGQPVRFIVDVKEDGRGCMGSIMIPDLYDTAEELKAGSSIVMAFTPSQTGDYLITCAMGVPRGLIKVID